MERMNLTCRHKKCQFWPQNASEMSGTPAAVASKDWVKVFWAIHGAKWAPHWSKSREKKHLQPSSARRLSFWRCETWQLDGSPWWNTTSWLKMSEAPGLWGFWAYQTMFIWPVSWDMFEHFAGFVRLFARVGSDSLCQGLCWSSEMQIRAGSAVSCWFLAATKVIERNSEPVWTINSHQDIAQCPPRNAPAC